MKYTLRLFIGFCGLLAIIPGLSQTAPVNATLQLTPPYSVYLSDYAVAGNEQMKLNLLLRDLTEPSYEIKLHLTVEGAGIRIETNPSFNPQPIILEGGVPTILGADDLAPYLDSRNLIFSGISRQQYDQRAALPEGFYRYCFRVLDYRRRDVELARETCANAWFVLNDPPRINTPLCGSILPLREPQNIYFQWLAMNSVSPNSALTTEYEFTLAEIRPAGRNPNDVINTSVPIYQTTIQETNLLYGITEPPLIPGQEYVFRIRAKDINGRDLFKNGGYSEVCTFKFGEGNLITPPEQVNVYTETESRARVTWFMNLETDRYKVEYRKKVSITETENSWFIKETIEDYTLLNDLQPDTEYEVRVAGIYRTFTSHPTETKTFRTPQPRVFACGQEAPVSIPPDTKPLITAMVGQHWKIGQFEMEVVSVQGGSGVFTGIGAVIIPYLGFRVYSKFEKLKVNENQEVVQGDVIALSEDWEVFKQNWQPEDPTPDIDDVEETPTEDSTTPEFVGVEVPYEGEIDSVYVNPDGDIVIINEEGEETLIDQPVNAETGELENTRITDSSGQQWVVDKDGNVIRPTEGSQESVTTTGTGNDTTKMHILYSNQKYLDKDAIFLPLDSKKSISFKVVVENDTTNQKTFTWKGVDSYTGDQAIVSLGKVTSGSGKKIEVTYKNKTLAITLNILGAYFTRLSDGSSGQKNIYGYDEMIKSDPDDDHISVESNGVTYVELKTSKNSLDGIFLKSDNNLVADAVIDGRNIKILAKTANKIQTTIRAFAKNDSVNSLASINVNVYDLVKTSGSIYNVYLSGDASTQISGNLNANSVKSEVNKYLKYLVVELDQLNSGVQMPIAYDLNGNGKVDIYKNANQHELNLIYSDLRANGILFNDIVRFKDPFTRNWIIMDSVKKGDKYILVRSSEVNKGFELTSPFGEYSLQSPKGLNSEPFSIVRITGDTLFINTNSGAGSVTGFIYDHPHTGSIVTSDVIVSRSQTAGLSPAEGRVSDPSDDKPAFICGPVTVSSMGTRLSHELMHGKNLRDVNDNTNIMHYNTSISIGNLPFTFKALDAVVTGTQTIDTTKPKQNQWEQIKGR